MNSGFKCLLVFIFGLSAMRAGSAERLGGISDETAPSVSQPEQAADREGGIVYRVICSPEGEMLPECGQPPVSDSFKAAQPQRTGPAIPDLPADAEAPNDAPAQAATKDRTKDSVKPAAPKKASAHKKSAKKAVKKTATKTSNKTATPVKKRKRP